MNLSLQKIQELLGLEITTDSSVMITGTSIDSRTASMGDLFFALDGEHVDGHDFVNTAFDNDCAAAVVSRLSKNEYTGTVLVVNNTIEALQKVASSYRDQFDIPVVALTGTNGKTTTKEMISAVLATEYKMAKTPGNLNNHIGLPLSICAWEEDIDVAILEMGTNHFGEIQRLCEIAKPSHALITNIGKGHLEFFDDAHGVAKAKSEILIGLAEDGKAFLNGDDSFLQNMKTIVADTTTFGFSEGCSLQAKSYGTDEIGFPSMSVNGHDITMPLPGEINLMNGLAAISLGLAFNISWKNIVSALSTVKAAHQRMHLIRESNIAILNDCYNANPSSMEQAFLACSKMNTYLRKIAVLGDMKEMGKASATEHTALGEKITAAGFNTLYAVGIDMKLTVEAARKSGIANVTWFENNQELSKALIADTQENDLVLIKGSRSMQLEDIVSALHQYIKSELRSN